MTPDLLPSHRCHRTNASRPAPPSPNLLRRLPTLRRLPALRGWPALRWQPALRGRG
ncbi:hypothetical protein ACFQ1L_02795 [Phytohabitans flavus]|uniref:Uncharacterized protein n=1 Tax=Phytohabitans flavus TaxID=1076124 RepID=A0A6F8Y4H9_9ACTN|nr:hypothetical protein [Phytohabitans flavus]BCB80929.1 hypothetical protein Pflav_073390 [Phytohabitans flavus]